MKNILIILGLTLFSLNSAVAQLNAFTVNDGLFSGSAAIDGASNFLLNKGYSFPRTNLTTFAFSGSNVKGFDGLVIYNTTIGNTQASGAGVGNQALVKGFYYFDNANGAAFGNPTAAGTWTALGSGGGGAFTITSNTPVDTHAINVAEDQEKVVSLVGSADGTTTHIDLGIANIAADAVKQFRKANIYDVNGKLVLIASGDYNVATNKFVTGNGFMNLLLPAADDYTVELYYTAN